jgi:NADH-quinone oxidoreductase subunit C
MDADLEAHGAAIAAALPGMIASQSVAFGDLTLNVARENWFAVIKHLGDHPDCRYIAFVDITAVDWPEREKRFDLVCHLLSPKYNRRIRVKTQVGEDEAVASVVPAFPGAEWYERETYDLFGILFTGHPDLRRILTDYGFDGHPLRKDFPTTGYVEVRYDDQLKRVVYEPVKLQQEYRIFDFLSPWEGPDYALPGDEKAKGQV